MSNPRVSVIVPTRNRAGELAKLLGSLGEQTYADFEVIVVDDGSSDDTASTTHGRSRVRYVPGDGSGAVAARCLGVKTARGDVLAFTDDDCVTDPGWLAAGVAAIDGGADVVQGNTQPQRETLPLERTVSHRADDGLFPTCNVFYRRDAYERAGGFDHQAEVRLGYRGSPSARALGFGEDTILGWSVARSGRAAPAPEAIVRHAVLRPRVRELVYREWVAGGFPALLREVPELRRTLVFRRIVLGRPGPRLGAYGLLLVIVPGLQVFGAAACALWIGGRVRLLARRPGSVLGKAVALPVELVLDVVRSFALVTGSVRARTLVI